MSNGHLRAVGTLGGPMAPEARLGGPWRRLGCCGAEGEPERQSKPAAPSRVMGPRRLRKHYPTNRTRSPAVGATETGQVPPSRCKNNWGRIHAAVLAIGCS